MLLITSKSNSVWHAPREVVRTVAVPPSIVVEVREGWFIVWSFVVLFSSCRVLCGCVLVVCWCVICFSSCTHLGEDGARGLGVLRHELLEDSVPVNGREV